MYVILNYGNWFFDDYFGNTKVFSGVLQDFHRRKSMRNIFDGDGESAIQFCAKVDHFHSL